MTVLEFEKHSADVTIFFPWNENAVARRRIAPAKDFDRFVSYSPLVHRLF
jgi:hypothetical protein